MTVTEPAVEQPATAPVLPKILYELSEDDLTEIIEIAEANAWHQATVISDLTDQERYKIDRIEKEHGPMIARRARSRLYNRHHWRSLRSFLFGTYVDIPVETDPTKPWDPKENPWIKIKIPGWAYTQDEHDEITPFKLLPDKPHLRTVSYMWVHENRVLIPKSRQVTMTWLFCCIACHEHLFRSARRTAFISKKFDDADALLDRVRTVKERLPSKRFEVPQVRKISGIFDVPDTHSMIQAMSEEAAALRQYTFSWVFFDEVEYSDNPSEIFRAANPTIQKDRFTGISSANGEGVFYDMVSDNGKIPVPAGA